MCCPTHPHTELPPRQTSLSLVGPVEVCSLGTCEFCKQLAVWKTLHVPENTSQGADPASHNSEEVCPYQPVSRQPDTR